MTLKLKPWSTVSRIDKIAMKVEPCPISKLNNFVVFRENILSGEKRSYEKIWGS